VWRVVPRARRPSGPAWVIGQLAHAALCRWRFPDQDDFEVFLHPYALQAGLTDEREIGNSVSTARRLLSRFQAHPLYAEMNEAERHHEVPYSLPGDDGRPKSGIIDALYRVSADEGWVVVEFKTDELRAGADLGEHIHEKEYDQQVAGYVEAVGRLLGKEPRAVIVFLNVGGGVQIEVVG